MSYHLVDPSSVLTWAHDWTDWLTDGDAIDTRQWTIDPDGSPSMLADAETGTVTASGFVAGQIYRLTEHIVTTNGLEDDRTIVIRADDR